MHQLAILFKNHDRSHYLTVFTQGAWLMLALRGMAWLLALQTLGELLARGLSLPFPGPVIGMLLLLVALQWEPVRAPVGQCADFLLAHLSLLFVPVGVGVMTHLSLVSQYGLRILAVIVLSTLAGLVVTVLTLHWLHPADDKTTSSAEMGQPALPEEER